MNVAYNWDDIHNVGDFCSYFGVGGAAGAIGAAAAVLAPAGVLPGVLYGALGGSLSGGILGGCNNLLKGLEMAENEGVKEIAMPAIGAGLGGRSWDDIRPLINEVASNHPSVDLYVVERYADFETKICYVRKYWEEEEVMYYLHFVEENAVRQIEVEADKTIYLSTEHPSCGDSFLCDHGLSMLDLLPEDYISKEEFENVWQSRK